MSDIAELAADLADLDSAPRIVKRRKKEALKKFKWSRVFQISNLVMLGLWLDLLSAEDNAERVFLFLSKQRFKGDWNVWDCVQLALIFLARSAIRRGEDPSDLIRTALAPGFHKDRLNGSLLEHQLKNLRSWSSQQVPLESICGLLEQIVAELRVMIVLGGSEKYTVAELELLEQKYRTQLIDTAAQA